MKSLFGSKSNLSSTKEKLKANELAKLSDKDKFEAIAPSKKVKLEDIREENTDEFSNSTKKAVKSEMCPYTAALSIQFIQTKKSLIRRKRFGKIMGPHTPIVVLLHHG